MRSIKKRFFKLSILFVLSFVSCNKQLKYDKSSRGTGWQMSGTKRGFIGSNMFKGQETGPGLVFVEGGSFIMGQVEDDVMRDYNNTPTRQHVMSFYMDETEVTNRMYQEYSNWVKKVFPPTEESYKNIYIGVLPDTLVWRNKLGFNEVMVYNYFRHPAYAEYPVVGVNWIQAVEFSKWRTDRVNEASLEKHGYLKKDAKTLEVSAENSFSTETYLAAPTMTFGGNEDIVLKGASGARIMPGNNKKNTPLEKQEKNVYAERSTGILLPEYRLPTEAEWEYVASSGVGQRKYNNYKGRRKYPWSGSDTQKSNSKKANQLANFKQANGDYGGIAGWSNDGADNVNVVKSYPPNDLGIYDMAGNVAEWVADVYRPIIDNQTNDFNYFRGNNYTKNSIGKDGKVTVYTKDNIKYDTLKNGKIVALGLPGQLITQPVDEAETFLRHNFDKAYEVNYKDGDQQSTRFFKSRTFDANNENNSNAMYNAPKHTITTDRLGNKIKKQDQSNTRTTLINDEVRVYKGGSWRDRAYWLSPPQRRFLSQEMASDCIGFRCAMSRVGLKSTKVRSRKN